MLWLYRALTFIVFDILTVLLVFGAITLFRHKKAAYRSVSSIPFVLAVLP